MKETVFPSYSEAVSYIGSLASAEGVSMKMTGTGDERVVFERSISDFEDLDAEPVEEELFVVINDQGKERWVTHGEIPATYVLSDQGYDVLVPTSRKYLASCASKPKRTQPKKKRQVKPRQAPSSLTYNNILPGYMVIKETSQKKVVQNASGDVFTLYNENSSEQEYGATTRRWGRTDGIMTGPGFDVGKKNY